MLLALAIAAWCVVSVVVALLLGPILRACSLAGSGLPACAHGIGRRADLERVETEPGPEGEFLLPPGRTVSHSP